MDKNTFAQVKKIIQESQNIVFLGGAGVSTASGIPDFRSAAGLYNQKTDLPYPPEYLLSHEFFVAHPDEFSDYIREHLIYEDAKPNNAHYALARLEQQGKLKAVITQNIDRLHQKAGSVNVLEIHGNLTDYYCVGCRQKYTLAQFQSVKKGALRCSKCSQVVRPDVVLYGEGLNMSVYYSAVKAIELCDVFIVGGTSLVVHPAAGLLDFYHGHKLVLINMDSTPADARADYILRGDVSQILHDLVN
ncbi:MAG: NAD-dependent protein deacylase [Clostridiales bacterium]|nr:NAD-dependent protein deacylase [Clostridiales bacterium]